MFFLSFFFSTVRFDLSKQQLKFLSNVSNISANALDSLQPPNPKLDLQFSWSTAPMPTVAPSSALTTLQIDYGGHSPMTSLSVSFFHVEIQEFQPKLKHSTLQILSSPLTVLPLQISIFCPTMLLL
jgi:hypothetical protein